MNKFFLGIWSALALFCLTANLATANPGDEHWDGRFGLPGATNRVYGLEVIGGKLYAGGYGSYSNLIVTNVCVESFDGTNWSGMYGVGGGSPAVYAFAVFQNQLYVGGTFSTGGGVPAVGLARWNGTTWSDVGGFKGIALSLENDGSALYVGGTFTNCGAVITTNIAKWDGNAWSAMGNGLGIYSTFGSYISEVIATNGLVYACGVFTNAGTSIVRNVAAWDGATWSEVGGGVNGGVYTMTFQGPDLLVGGNFTAAGGSSANCVAKWNGVSWSAFGSGLTGGVSAGGIQGGPVTAIGALGGNIIAGGSFTNSGSLRVTNLARWNGSAWTAMGTLNGQINRIRSDGASLYIGGLFNQIDNLIANHVVRWDGSQLQSVGKGQGIAALSVQVVASDTNSIYAGGFFTAAGSTQAAHIARWNGTQWNDLGGGVTGNGLGNSNVVR
ncbi:MAG: hypothetical protein ACXWC8_19885, partial [Limisphaerales bacterium]